MTKLFLCICLVGLASCRKEAPTAPVEDQEPAPTNRIAVPESVRRNLGIEYVKVERRRVSQTLRAAGSFELLPAGRHEHRTPLTGRVQILVQPLQRIEAGTPLYRIEAPEWQRMQRELGELVTAIRVGEARTAQLQPLIAAHRVHEESLQEAISVMDAQAKVLDEVRTSVGGQAQEIATVRVQVAQMRAALAEAVEKRAETQAQLAELEANLAASRDRFQLALETAATVVGRSTSALVEETPHAGTKLPTWRTIGAIEVRAAAAGVVDKLPVATGVWVETGELVVTIADLSQVRFHARGLQSDLASLRDGLPARVVPPHEGGKVGEPLPGTLLLGVEADPSQRTIDLFVQLSSTVEWSRPGVAGFLEVETRGGSAAEIAIPLSAVLTDGLQRVFFRRDPADADKVIRIEADLGLDDGRWVEVKSGLTDTDEVVFAGAYELMLASSGTAAKGGHFHSDGTFHEGKDK